MAGVEKGRLPWLSSLSRLWLLPVCVAIAYLISIPFSSDGTFSNNALIVLEVPLATFTLMLVLTVILLPVTALHTWLMNTLERRGASLVARAAIALSACLPVVGLSYLVIGDDDGFGAWVLFVGSLVLFSCASVWYGSRRLRRSL